MIDSLPPGIILMVGGLFLALLRGKAQKVALLLLPILSAAHLLALPHDLVHQATVFGYTLTPIRIDPLSLVWGYIFHIAALVSALYALHVDDRIQHVSAFVYAGGAIAAVFAGDLVTLFIYWELTAVSSVFLIFARRTERAYHAGIRYLVVQVASGVLLLSGIIFHYRDTGSLAFESFTSLGLAAPGPLLIFIAFGVKCAFPFLHNWLQDAYPEATESGAVFLSSFTTKLAIYALARGFAGSELLIAIGATMTVFPIFYAVIENDLRRVLAYSLNIQLGFMVVGIGIGSDLALNGTAAHAFSHVIYEGLLFMSMGAVLYRTGTVKGSELGGLYKSMPWTTGFCMVGAASVSAFPFFSAFVTKSLILTAAAEEGHALTFLVLLFASAGVLHYCGIKVPYFAFFARDSGIRVKEAPANMLAAMAITAALCIGIGILPNALYAILPFPVDYHPYSLSHVVTQYQLLLFSALAFTVLMRTGIYPPNLRAVNLDSDWLYRRLGRSLALGVARTATVVYARCAHSTAALADTAYRGIVWTFGRRSWFSRTSSTANMVLWCTVLLSLYLVIYYLH